MRLPRLQILVLGTVIAVLAVTPAVADRFYEFYERGEKALRDQDWDGAIDQFNLAIQERPAPGTSVRTYGMNFINYHPYLKLGIAYFNQGAYDLALSAFDAEEGFGAIKDSKAELQSLQDHRGQAQKAKADAEQQDGQRVETLISNSLQRAATLEKQGLLDDAMAELGKVFALDEEHAAAKEALQRLRSRVAQEQAARDVAGRVDTLVQQGDSLFADGKYEEAGSVLSQALKLDPDNARTTDLLRRSQGKLREQIQATQDAEAQQALIATGLRDARDLQDRQEFEGALTSLQTVLVLEPENAQALQLQGEILESQNLAAEEHSRVQRVQEVDRLLGRSRKRLGQQDYPRALASLNRVLALDPGNGDAATLMAQAFAGMRALDQAGRAAPTVLSLPPVITLRNIPDDLLKLKRDQEQALSRLDEIKAARQVSLDAGNWTNSDQQQFLAEEAELLAKVSNLDGRIEDGLFVEQRSMPSFRLIGTVQSTDPRVKGTVRMGETLADVVLMGRRRVGAFYLKDFNVDLHLPAGDSNLELVFTDSRGLMGVGTYHVHYLRSWFYLVYEIPRVVVWSLVALPFLALALFLATRIRRRRLLRKRRFNPYIAGAPVLNKDLFFGREGMLERILQTIHNNSILLYGERRIGKTSLQHHLKKRLQEMKDPEFDFYPVLIDLQGTPEERFFGTLAVDIFEQLGPLLDGTGAHKDIPDTMGYRYQDLVRDLRGVLKVLKGRSSKTVKLVLLIDEVDELNNYDPRVNQKLRSLFMKNMAENLVSVVSGVGIKKRWDSEGSPWYNFFEEIPVKPFTEKDAERLIREPIQGIFQLENGVVQKIISLADCRPFRIQKLCVALVNRLYEEKRKKISLEDVASVKSVAEG